MKYLMTMVFTASLFFGMASSVAADGCYLCGSGSTNGCQQCRYGSSDTQDQRKKCEKAGCKVSGTGSCSTAANVKVCTAKANIQFDEFMTMNYWEKK